MIVFIGLESCDTFLEKKSDKSLGIPTSISDFQALLDSFESSYSFCSSGEASSDDYYINDEDYNSLYYEGEKRLHTWQPDYVSRPKSSGGDEWSNLYRSVYVYNSVLKGIEDNKLEGQEADHIRGRALMQRATRFLDGVQIWSPVYNENTAADDLGMVLRLDPDMHQPSIRSSVQETYDLILSDLKESINLLPDRSKSPILPSKSAAHGLLARAFLIMGHYEDALFHAQEAFDIYGELIDFNGLDATLNYPIPSQNQVSVEMVFHTVMYMSDLTNVEKVRVSPSLYDLYEEGDLRKEIFFKENTDGTFQFRGTHMGHRGLSTGIMSSELLLIMAECNVRLNKLSEGADALNNLLVKRWDSAVFTPYVFTDKNSALEVVLKERRKELAFRGLRWSDIKRLNRDGYEITLTRKVNNELYSLPPNDFRFAIAIPESVIELGGIEQNPR